MNQNIKDDSGDRQYFIMAPQLVWALCRDPYDFTLWSVIKMIAAEHGECFLSTNKLAKLAMMSVGKVQDCRDFLLESGLLHGELKPVNKEGQSVWHLTIPDIWRENIEWRQNHHSLKSRIDFKAGHKSIHQVNAFMKELSSSESKHSSGVDKEEPEEKPENHVLPKNSNLDPVAHVLSLNGKTSESTGPAPADQWLETRNEPLVALEAGGGSLAREPNARQKQKSAVIALAERPDWNKELFEAAVEDCIMHSVAPANIAKFRTVYEYYLKHGQDYDGYIDDKYNTQGKDENPMNGKAPPLSPDQAKLVRQLNAQEQANEQ